MPAVNDIHKHSQGQPCAVAVHTTSLPCSDAEQTHQAERVSFCSYPVLELLCKYLSERTARNYVTHFSTIDFKVLAKMTVFTTNLKGQKKKGGGREEKVGWRRDGKISSLSNITNEVSKRPGRMQTLYFLGSYTFQHSLLFCEPHENQTKYSFSRGRPAHHLGNHEFTKLFVTGHQNFIKLPLQNFIITGSYYSNNCLHQFKMVSKFLLSFISLNFKSQSQKNKVS